MSIYTRGRVNIDWQHESRWVHVYITVYVTTLCELHDLDIFSIALQDTREECGGREAIAVFIYHNGWRNNHGNHNWYVPFPDRGLNLRFSHVKRSFQSLCWGFRCGAIECKFIYYEKLGIKYWTSTFILCFSVKRIWEGWYCALSPMKAGEWKDGMRQEERILLY